MNILNGTEAFAAMMAGRNILCRAVGELIDFDDLDQFPATVFAKTDYEFCIKIETMELAGITFEKPLTLDDVQLGDDVYIIQASGEIHHYKYEVCHEILNQSIARGFAQRDQNNAQLQSEAFCKIFDRVYRQADIVEVNAQTKTKRRSRKTEELAANDSSIPVEKKTFESQSNIQIIEQGPVTVVEDSLIEEPIETDAVKLVEKFTVEINAAETVDAALTEDPVQLSQSIKMEYMVALTGATQLDAIAGLENEVNKDSRLLDNHKGILNTYIKTRRRVINEASKPTEIAEPIHEHQEHLKEILADIALAKTPVEVNAQIKYTKSWSEEQRKPVIMAMNARLIELSQLNVEVTETPSLMVQIQNAPDLTALDVLEIDVGSRHPDIQPNLMKYVKSRRFELENGINPIGAAV